MAEEQREPGVTDPAVPERSEQLDQIQPQRSLDDRGVADVLDEGYSPPERWSAAERHGNTVAEQAAGEPLDQRLAEEEPDPALAEPLGAEPGPAAGGGGDGPAGAQEVGDRRAGRLAEAGAAEPDGVATDVGIAGAAAGAEEAAVHVLDESDADR